MTLEDFARAAYDARTDHLKLKSARWEALSWEEEKYLHPIFLAEAAGVLRAVAASAHELAGDPLSGNESFKAGWQEACAYLQIVLERIAAEGTQP